VTIAANFDYCDSIAIGENTTAIVLHLYYWRSATCIAILLGK